MMYKMIFRVLPVVFLLVPNIHWTKIQTIDMSDGSKETTYYQLDIINKRVAIRERDE